MVSAAPESPPAEHALAGFLTGISPRTRTRAENDRSTRPVASACCPGRPLLLPRPPPAPTRRAARPVS